MRNRRRWDPELEKHHNRIDAWLQWTWTGMAAGVVIFGLFHLARWAARAMA